MAITDFFPILHKVRTKNHNKPADLSPSVKQKERVVQNHVQFSFELVGHIAIERALVVIKEGETDEG